ncbi:alpha/beta hydrolase [Xenorhabdus sp. KJ12.1]|uniref:alpha/beta hydrolase n=1 Tax=Xenorhabdus sp. KJ12.1 TaxID=1851571 RepID=UPI000C0503D5|nr:alpha/beta fold hydrolase [Xenorhabdus sp. KJ12.1]PHM72295.1 hypothetical protein Xekj_00573 [Xenorhabdus sp. KJ12.1]
MYSNIETIKKITHLNNELVVHSWIPNAIESIVIYVHGLQSHAAWSWEFALDFTQKNAVFICMDRPGSGISLEKHDEFPCAEYVISSYRKLFEHVFTIYPDIPVIAVGHCLGGSILTATLAQSPSIVKKLKAISIVSSWLDKMHTSLDIQQQRTILNDKSDDLWDVGLFPEDFSSLKKYQDFIYQDPLTIRAIKLKTRKNIFMLEDKYISLHAPFSTIRSQYISSYGDRVIDVKSAITAYMKYYGEEWTIHLFGSKDHYIPFTKYRQQLANIILSMIHDVETIV